MKQIRFLKQKGISQIFLLVSMLVVAVSLPIATKLVQQNQENRSQAAITVGGSCNSITDTQKKCSGSTVVECIRQYASPAKWVTVETCRNGCSNGKCNSLCSVGSYRCNGTTQLQKCSNSSNALSAKDGWVVWSNDTYCPSIGKVCKTVSGVAGCYDDTIASVCTPNQKRCKTGSTTVSQTCNSTGTAWVDSTCPSGKVCSSGSCFTSCSGSGGRCSSSSSDCTAGVLYVPGASDCLGQFCCKKATVPVCTANTYKCDGRNLMVCKSDGSGWSLSRECGIDQTCNATTKTCNAKVVACTSFTYSAWGNCINGTQTRTVATRSPSGCTGGNPDTSRSCKSAQCGSYNGSTSVTRSPNGTEACYEGGISFSDSTAASGYYRWTCTGVGTGNVVSCSAKKYVAPTCSATSCSACSATQCRNTTGCYFDGTTGICKQRTSGCSSSNCGACPNLECSSTYGCYLVNGVCTKVGNTTPSGNCSSQNCRGCTTKSNCTAVQDGKCAWDAQNFCRPANSCTDKVPNGACRPSCGSNEQISTVPNSSADCRIGGSGYCCVPKTSTKINGACKTYPNGVNDTTTKNSDWCTAGTVYWTDVAGTDGVYNWRCDGANGGTNATCSARRLFNGCPTSGLVAGNYLSLGSYACGIKSGETDVRYKCEENGKAPVRVGRCPDMCRNGVCVGGSQPPVPPVPPTATPTLQPGETSLILSATKVELYPGEKQLITAKVMPSGEVISWLGNNPSVAYVSEPNGNNIYIVAVSPGQSVVTVTDSNGKTATIQVTVKDGSSNDEFISGIHVDPQEATIEKGKEVTIKVVLDVVKLSDWEAMKDGNIDQSKITKVTWTPNSKYKLVWTSKSPAVATVSSAGVVKGVSVGEVDIDVSPEDLDPTETVKIKVVSGSAPVSQDCTNPTGKNNDKLCFVNTNEIKTCVNGTWSNPVACQYGCSAGSRMCNGAPTDKEVNFKITFDGVRPNAECISVLDLVDVEVANVPTNKYQGDLSSGFSLVNGEVDSRDNQVFQVNNLVLDPNTFKGVNKFNYIRVKGPFHLKRRMCQDNQNGKIPEHVKCDISLDNSDKVYNFKNYTLLAGDVVKDGVINTADRSFVKTRFNPSAEVLCGREGDLNLDGVVNSIDMDLVKYSLSEIDDE